MMRPARAATLNSRLAVLAWPALLGLSWGSGLAAEDLQPVPAAAQVQFVTNAGVLDPSPSRWGYAVIGRVIAGMDVIESASIATAATSAQ